MYNFSNKIFGNLKWAYLSYVDLIPNMYLFLELLSLHYVDWSSRNKKGLFYYVANVKNRDKSTINTQFS